MQIAVLDIVVTKRRRKDYGDLAELAESIRRQGLLHPLVLNSRQELVVGERRLRAVKILGWSHVECCIQPSFDNLLELLQAEYAENKCRKEMTPSEIVYLTSDIWKLEADAARARRADAGRTRNGQAAKHGYAPRPVAGATRDKVAQAVGLSGRTLEKARTVVAAAESDPDTFGPVQEEMDRTGRVNTAYQKVRVQVRAPRSGYDDLADLLTGWRKSLGRLCDRRGPCADWAAALPAGQRRLLAEPLDGFLAELTVLLSHLRGDAGCGCDDRHGGGGRAGARAG